jgi:hypothetical protein
VFIPLGAAVLTEVAVGGAVVTPVVAGFGGGAVEGGVAGTFTGGVAGALTGGVDVVTGGVAGVATGGVAGAVAGGIGGAVGGGATAGGWVVGVPIGVGAGTVVTVPGWAAVGTIAAFESAKTFGELSILETHPLSVIVCGCAEPYPCGVVAAGVWAAAGSAATTKPTSTKLIFISAPNSALQHS